MISVFTLAAGDCYWIGDAAETTGGLGIYVHSDLPVLKHKGETGNLNLYDSKDAIKGITFWTIRTTNQFETICWVQKFGLTANDIHMLNMDRSPAL